MTSSFVPLTFKTLVRTSLSVMACVTVRITLVSDMKISKLSRSSVLLAVYTLDEVSDEVNDEMNETV